MAAITLSATASGEAAVSIRWTGGVESVLTVEEVKRRAMRAEGRGDADGSV